MAKRVRLSETTPAQEPFQKYHHQNAGDGAYHPRRTPMGFRQHQHFGSDPEYYAFDKNIFVAMNERSHDHLKKVTRRTQE